MPNNSPHPQTGGGAVLQFPGTADPFGLAETLLTEADQRAVELARLEPSDGSGNASDPVRSLCRQPDGRLFLMETRPSQSGSGWEQVRIGVPISFDEASQMAVMVLSGADFTRCLPHALNALAIAFMGARCSAARRASAQQGASA